MNKNKYNPKRYLTKFRDFLDSGTPGAKATEVSLIILALASLPVLVFIAAAMGNAVQVFKQFETSRHFSKKQIRNSLNHLRRKKLIEYVCDRNGKTIIKITRKGETRLHAFSIDLMTIKKPSVWDGKWRLVMFDIPLRFTKGREALRYHLKDLGFYQFQKSAWIYPYPCEDEIIFIADFFGVRKFIEILTVKEMLNERELKNKFGLK
ncbi:MAG: hypothetical protein Q8O46_03510 [bacterium]|nr:hypothetical protein [bacterium]